MTAWLFTILRDHFRSEYRRRRREVEDAGDGYAAILKSHAAQEGHIEFKELRMALAKLLSDQRKALVLVGASRFSYEETAQICGCAVGAIKSRVNRARTRLAEIMSIESAYDFGRDHTTRAVLAGNAPFDCNV
jgi:RNA polymerase sigma-70 factor, ECF subfamily